MIEKVKRKTAADLPTDKYTLDALSEIGHGLYWRQLFCSPSWQTSFRQALHSPPTTMDPHSPKSATVPSGPSLANCFKSLSNARSTNSGSAMQNLVTTGSCLKMIMFSV